MAIQFEKGEGKFAATVVCWLLGIGCLFSWNSMVSIIDYYAILFPKYHPARVLPIVYQPLAVGVLLILSYNEAKINTRKRNLFGYFLFFMSSLMILVVIGLGTSGKGGIGTYVGICIVSGAFGVGDAFVQGGMIGDLSLMCPDFIQSFLAGMAASGVLTTGLRLITKAAFENSRNGLRKGAMMYFAVSMLFELLCLILYAYVFPKLPTVKCYRSKAASEGSKTVFADLAAGGIQVRTIMQASEENPAYMARLNNKQLLAQNMDYAIAIFVTFVLTFSIFPGFLSEDTRKHSLGSWYVLLIIATQNVSNLIGRYIPLIDSLKLKSRRWLLIVSFSRFLLIPCFYYAAKYGDQGWMIMLTSFLGLSQGYLPVCLLTGAPKNYKGPEKNALGNLLVLFLGGGVLAGVTLSWVWLIGKGW
ncbi:equilibrative nucleotide transporter 2-like [Papaver somniferum]|uniref:equilibrative nucleotide transporter 2-like n=1 Tax=Papaver somniferum TaxID=3469 RepID=UPI000E6F947E|nr:equilibrative nucleotide transporter 2-like [Papaver somniferum]